MISTMQHDRIPSSTNTSSGMPLLESTMFDDLLGTADESYQDAQLYDMTGQYVTSPMTSGLSSNSSIPSPHYMYATPIEDVHVRHADNLRITTPIPTSAYRLETFFFQRFISSVWLHSQSDAWRYYLPGVLNSSPALYYSVMSLSALYMCNTGADVRARDMVLSLYQTTLTHLQKALYDPVLALEDTTLMATVIIGLYELIDKPGHDTWCQHSRGTAELLKIRGAANSKSGMGRMLFLTFRGFEVVRAILQQEETFVADKAWSISSSDDNTIMQSAGALVDSNQSMPAGGSLSQKAPVDHAAVLFMLGGQTANFQAVCKRTQAKGQMTPATQQRLIEQAKALESRFHTWRGGLPQSYNGREKLSVVEASPYRSVQEFDTYPMAYQLVFYSAFLLLLHRTIAKYIIKDVQKIPVTDQDYARFIIKTAEFLTQGLTTASLHVTWPIYMASISLRDEVERRWTVTLLRTIVQDKGWAVANAALHAANIIARKNQLRGSVPGVLEDFR